MFGSSKTLLDLTRGHRLRYGLAVAALLLATLLGLLAPLAGKRAVDALAVPGGADLGALAAGALAMVLLTALSGGFTYLKGRWSAIAAEGICRDLRDRLFDHLQRLPTAYHDRADTGDLVQRASSDVETVRLFLAVQLVDACRASLMVVTVLPLMIYVDSGMALVSVALFPAIIAFALIYFGRIRGRFLAADEAEAALTSDLHENLTGIRVVRAFARQDFERAKFARVNGEYRDRTQHLIRLLGAYWSLSDLLCISQIGLVALVGAARLREGTLGAGALFVFLSYVYLLIGPVRHLGRLLSEMGKATVSLGRIREVLAEFPEADPPGTPAAPGGPGPEAGRLVVRDLSFSHAGSPLPALSGVSFTLEPGETLALLGPPGAGKSTLIHLLLRLYDHETGAIELDGRELRTLSRGFVRSRIGCVLQEPFLFSKTLLENLMLGRPEAAQDAVIESARMACVHDAIVAFEHGYETLVGERGVTLSGGQRQRVALARALLKDPPVLILDDALSAVDTGTEARILEALRARRGRRTTLVIAHRLTTLMHADRILVLEGGRVVQEGTHAALAAADGTYRRLWRIQSSLEQEIGRDLSERETAPAGVLQEGR